MTAPYQDSAGGGRGLTREQVREVARGRVWTGAQALEHRLVDRLGGFQTALARARELAGIDADARVQLRFYPAQENPFNSLGKFFGVSSEAVEGLARVNAALSDPRVQRAMAAIREEEAGVRAEAQRLNAIIDHHKSFRPLRKRGLCLTGAPGGARLPA